MSINYPDTAPDGRPFGDVGTYVESTNTLDTTTHDGLLVWLDVEAVMDFYKNRGSGTPILTQQQMIDAGFGQTISPPVQEEIGGVTYTYNNFLDIQYAVHTVDPDHDEFASVTEFEKLIKHLTLNMSTPVMGDILLDGSYDENDFDYAFDVYTHHMDDEVRCRDYIWTKETSLGHTPTVPSVYQMLYNSTPYSETLNITENDITVLRGMLSNIYHVREYPVDTSVFTGNSATFSIELGKAPAIDNYIYDWKMIQTDGTVTQLGSIDVTSSQTSSRTINTVTAAMNAAKINVTIYEPYVASIPAGTPYTDTDYYHSRIYTAYLYTAVKSSVLWGDTDDNGVVNILDAYRVLNNYNYYRGDTNRDGYINALDASTVMAYYARISVGDTPEAAAEELSTNNVKFTVDDFKRCDMNQDGVTDSVDASTILQIYSMLSTTTMTIDEVAAELGIVIDPKNSEFPTHTKGDLAALITTGSVKPSKVTKVCGQAILEAIKDNTKSLH